MSIVDDRCSSSGRRSHPPALPPEMLCSERCLDRQLAERLTEYFHCPFAALPGGLSGALRLWQWEFLVRTLLHASTKSLHYRRGVGRKRALRLIRTSEAACGLPHLPLNQLRQGRSLYAPERRPDPVRAAAALEMLSAGLPQTLPHDLATASDSFLALSQDAVEGVISLSTSGTTGPGKRIYCSSGDLARTASFFQHGMRYMVRPGRGEHVALLMSGDRPGSVGDLLQRGLRALGVPCSVPGFAAPGPEGESAMLHRLASLRPTCLVGVPAQVFALARRPDAGRVAASVRTVLLSGDAVTASLRAGIAAGFGCEVFVHYGLTETGLGGAVECGEHDGCHVREADLLIEILDASGRALPPGVCGEIVITTLTREAMPLLRYRTGDEGSLLPGPCACGSVFGRVQALGRMNQRLPLPDGSVLRLSDLDSLLYALPCIRGYGATLHRGGENGRDCLVLDLRPAAEADASWLEQAGRALSALRGLRLIAEASDLHSTDPELLPLLLRADGEDAAGTMPPQAKQSIRETQDPLFPAQP